MRFLTQDIFIIVSMQPVHLLMGYTKIEKIFYKEIEKNTDEIQQEIQNKNVIKYWSALLRYKGVDFSRNISIGSFKV